MLTNFTWWEFFGFYCLSLLLYYSLIISIYFRPEVSRLLGRINSTVPPLATPNASESTAQEAPSAADPISDEETNQLIESLKKEIVGGIKSAKDTGASLEDLLSLLKSILSKYPELKMPGQRSQANEFIIQQAGAVQYPVQMFQVYALWPQASRPA